MAKSSEEKKTTKRRSKKSAEAVENAVIETKDEVVETKDEVVEAKDEVVEAKDEVVEAKDEVVEAKDEVVEAKNEVVKATPDDDQPDVAENERIKRYDVMITSERAGYRPPKAAVAAMVQQLAFRGFASPVDEAVAEKWTEIYFEPGPAAHEIFLEKGYNSDAPVYHEMMMRFCEKPFYCDYAENPKRPLYWCIEIRGSRFQNPFGAFKKLFLDAFSLRISVADRPAQPLPEHLTVPEDEAPIERKKRERGHGLAGTEVEEM